MGARVAVAGASGYGGGELLRLLASHPDLEIGAVTGDSSAGKTVGEVHPQLAGVRALADRVFEPHWSASLAGCDLVFTALPAGHSAVLVGTLPRDVKVVDLGPDFRLADPAAWSRHYSGEHPGRWVTGLPELPGQRAAIAAASRVAAPGCYATAAIMALTPIVTAGLVQPQDVVVVAASGTSGAGRSLRTDLLASEVMGSVSAYQVGGTHRHTAEIEQALTEIGNSAKMPAGTDGTAGRSAAGGVAVAGWAGERGDSGRGSSGSSASSATSGAGGRPNAGGPGGADRVGGPPVSVSFTPVLAPMPRGILATCTARLVAPLTATAALRAAIADAYAGADFVCLLPEGRWPATASVAGSNGVQLQATVDERAGRAVVVAAIDNLGKGAAGQAIQNANLMLGLPETAGLTAGGVAP